MILIISVIYIMGIIEYWENVCPLKNRTKIDNDTDTPGLSCSARRMGNAFECTKLSCFSSHL